MNLIKGAWKRIAIPQQMPYKVADLGPEKFKLDDGTVVKRVDFSVKNKRKQNIKASLFYKPKNLNFKNNRCVVFCNSRNGNRLQGLEHLGSVIKTSSFCIFDYSGSGHSNGRFCTLGEFEKDDIDAIILFLNKKYFVNDVVLWGRSMGAVSSVLFWETYEKSKDKKDRLVRGLVLDSPYISSKDVIARIVKFQTSYPIFMIKMGLLPVSSTLKEKTHADILGINIKHVFEDLDIPIYFLVGKEDEVTPVEIVKSLHDEYKYREKYLNLIEGEHHSMRTSKIVGEIKEFIDLVFSTRKEKKIEKKEKIENPKSTGKKLQRSMEEEKTPIKIKRSQVYIKDKPKLKKGERNKKEMEEEIIETRLEKDKVEDIWVFK